MTGSQILMNVIHRHFDEDDKHREWRIYAFSAIITFRKRGSDMAVKYTEEQLNNVDKSFLVALLLDQQEQMESLTEELRETNEKMQKLMVTSYFLTRRKRYVTLLRKNHRIWKFRLQNLPDVRGKRKLTCPVFPSNVSTITCQKKN